MTKVGSGHRTEFSTWQSLTLNYLNSSFYLSFIPKAGSISSLSIKIGNTAVDIFTDFWCRRGEPEEWRYCALVVVVSKAGGVVTFRAPVVP